MLERMLGHILPERELKPQMEKPAVALVVKLPYRFNDIDASREKFTRVSMHIDMMTVLARSLNKIKPGIRSKLLIQGRMMDGETWGRLREHPAYQFFYSYREDRANLRSRKKTLRILMPNTSEITERQVKRYHGLDFKPESLSKELGFKVAWYPADFIKGLERGEMVYDSLAPYLGAVNQFKIGSDKLVPGMVRAIAVRLMAEFEDRSSEVARSIKTRVNEDALEASAKIFKIS